MRPCNQCHQPVENGVLVCQTCQQYNELHNLEAPQQIKTNPGDNVDQAKNEDRSLRQVANAFYLIIVLLGAMLGLAFFGTFHAFVIGGLIGLVGCALFLRLVFAGM